MATLPFIPTAEDMNLLRRLMGAQQEAQMDAERTLILAERRLTLPISISDLGKNDKERDAAKLRLLSSDREWRDAETALYEAKRRLITLKTEYDCLVNSRRAYEKHLEAIAVGVGDTELDPPADDSEGNHLGVAAD